MLSLFLSAFVLGIIFNAAPGAVFAETVRQGARGGYSAALAVQFGSLVGDTTWAVLGLAGIGLLLQLDALRLPVGIAGALYLLYLSWDSWKAAKQEFTVKPSEGVARSALKAGVLLSVTNPQNIAYIAALGSAMGAVGVHAPSTTDYAVFFVGLMSASLVWCFICAWIVARIFKHANPRWTTITYQLCAVAFFALAVASVKELLSHPSAASSGAKAAISAPSAPL
jgi:chemosensory pili system protein ChpE